MATILGGFPPASAAVVIYCQGHAGLTCQVTVLYVDVHGARGHVIPHGAGLPHEYLAAAVRRAVYGNAGDLNIGIVRRGVKYCDSDVAGILYWEGVLIGAASWHLDLLKVSNVREYVDGATG